jgi:hypothetical protein
MATLETQYENYLLENPTKEITFEEWKDNILFSEAELDLLKKKIELEKMEGGLNSNRSHDPVYGC